jgi:hypothetical protein
MPTAPVGACVGKDTDAAYHIIKKQARLPGVKTILPVGYHHQINAINGVQSIS